MRKPCATSRKSIFKTHKQVISTQIDLSFFYYSGGFCCVALRKNRLSSQPTAVQSMIVPSFLTLHTIVDCIVPAKTRGINCFSTSANNRRLYRSILLVASLLRWTASRVLQSLPQEYLFSIKFQ